MQFCEILKNRLWAAWGTRHSTHRQCQKRVWYLGRTDRRTDVCWIFWNKKLRVFEKSTIHFKSPSKFLLFNFNFSKILSTKSTDDELSRPFDLFCASSSSPPKFAFRNFFFDDFFLDLNEKDFLFLSIFLKLFSVNFLAFNPFSGSFISEFLFLIWSRLLSIAFPSSLSALSELFLSGDWRIFESKFLKKNCWFFWEDFSSNSSSSKFQKLWLWFVDCDKSLNFFAFGWLNEFSVEVEFSVFFKFSNFNNSDRLVSVCFCLLVTCLELQILFKIELNIPGCFDFLLSGFYFLKLWLNNCNKILKIKKQCLK